MAKKIPKSGDISVTVQMLNEFRDDLKYFFTSKFLELRADMNSLEAKFDAKLSGVEARLGKRIDHLSGRMDHLSECMDHLSGRMDRMDAGFTELKSDIHHVKLLCETQNQQSQMALDGARHAVEEVVILRERIDKMV